MYTYFSGIFHFLHRDYDPVFQRWLNRDPIGEAGGINLYGFVRNNPLRYVDPFGLEEEEGKDREEDLPEALKTEREKAGETFERALRNNQVFGAQDEKIEIERPEP